MVANAHCIYTVITLLNSVLYLCNAIYEDPGGNWHELDREFMFLRKKEGRSHHVRNRVFSGSVKRDIDSESSEFL